MEIIPGCDPEDTGTITAFGTVSPDMKFRFETTGLEELSGHTVRYPGLVGLIAVTFSTTAVAEAGTPPVPEQEDIVQELLGATFTFNVVPPVSVLPWQFERLEPDNWLGSPLLVSHTLYGVIGVKVEPPGLPTYPSTSITTSLMAYEYIEMQPVHEEVEPKVTSTKFGTTVPFA